MSRMSWEAMGVRTDGTLDVMRHRSRSSIIYSLLEEIAEAQACRICYEDPTFGPRPVNIHLHLKMNRVFEVCWRKGCEQCLFSYQLEAVNWRDHSPLFEHWWLFGRRGGVGSTSAAFMTLGRVNDY